MVVVPLFVVVWFVFLCSQTSSCCRKITAVVWFVFILIQTGSWRGGGKISEVAHSFFPFPFSLYSSWQWDDRAIRRLIADGKLAPRLKGTDTRMNPTDHECPICFLCYQSVNQTACCQADICTECYLQVRPQKIKTCACPFCNSNKFNIVMAKTMDSAAVEERELQEQQVIEAKIRSQQTSSGFGSNMEQNTAVRLMRARSESMSSTGTTDVVEDVTAIAMTPEDRHVLEEEIRAQHVHPLARQVEREADDRRLENERNYYRSQSGRSAAMRARVARMSSDSRLLGSRNRNWNEIVDAFESNGSGQVNSLDDLVVLEAAILLSMAEEERRDGGDSGRFDASQHARQGFPLVQSRLLADPPSSARAQRSISVARRARVSQRAAARPEPEYGSHNFSSNMLLRGISEAEQIEMAIAMSLQQQESNSNNASGVGEENGGEEDTERAEAATQTVFAREEGSTNDELVEGSASSESSGVARDDVRGEANGSGSGSSASLSMSSCSESDDGSFTERASAFEANSAQPVLIERIASDSQAAIISEQANATSGEERGAKPGSAHTTERTASLADTGTVADTNETHENQST